MANIKSSKKDIKRIKIRTMRNRARMSEIKTVIKKLNFAVVAKDDADAQRLFRLAQSKIARAKGKGLLKANTASRRIKKLSKAVSSLEK